MWLATSQCSMEVLGFADPKPLGNENLDPKIPISRSHRTNKLTRSEPLTEVIFLTYLKYNISISLIKELLYLYRGRLGQMARSTLPSVMTLLDL